MTGALAPGLNRAALLAEVTRVCDEHLRDGSTVILALSGGPDSTAMSYLVAEARPDLQLFAAHVRHGLRDDRTDARIAAEHAAGLGIGYLERAVAVVAGGKGVEAAARDARYAALVQLARQVSAAAVLVGHSADDQAETVLLNLVRGSGLRGMSGMAPVRDLDGLVLVRPLLRIRRSDLRSFIAGEGLQAAQDPTNLDPQQRRARVRTRALPALAGLAGGPGDPVAALCRLADLARVDADALDVVAQGYAERLVHRWGPGRCLRRGDLDALPGAVSARVIRAVLASVRGSADGLTSEAVDVVRNLGPGEAAHVPGGVWVTSGGGWLGVVPADIDPIATRSVIVPGSTVLPELEIAISADAPWSPVSQTTTGQLVMAVETVPPLSLARAGPVPPGPLPPGPVPPGPVPPGARGTAAGPWVVLPDDVARGLAVRARRPGDRLRLAHGTRKLQDLFTDQGVPRAIRDLVPVVVDAHDEPVWVPGVSQRHMDPSAPAAVRLWLHESGGAVSLG